MRKKKWLKISIYLFATLLSVELILRFVIGLGDMPIYIVNKNYEYIYAPNQTAFRFGNEISTNEFSMRSKSLSKKDKLKILLIGDSVINGGVHNSNDELASTLLENKAESILDNTRVLNISAGSWGPDNSYAYIQQHGNFDAKHFVIVLSSQDYNDNMHHRDVVGVHSSWPKEKPMLAITDAWGRYVWPKIKGVFVKQNEYAYLDGFDDSAVNSGWMNYINYCNQITLTVYLHATKEERSKKKYLSQGQKLLELLYLNKVNVVQGLSLNMDDSNYRDNIHLNEKGQKVLSEHLWPIFEEILKKEKNN